MVDFFFEFGLSVRVVLFYLMAGLSGLPVPGGRGAGRAPGGRLGRESMSAGPPSDNRDYRRYH